MDNGCNFAFALAGLSEISYLKYVYFTETYATGPKVVSRYNVVRLLISAFHDLVLAKVEPNSRLAGRFVQKL